MRCDTIALIQVYNITHIYTHACTRWLGGLYGRLEPRSGQFNNLHIVVIKTWIKRQLTTLFV